MDLKPCPFCGSEPVLSEGDNHFYVECEKFVCCIGPDREHATEAVEAWNKRVQKTTEKAVNVRVYGEKKK